MDLITIVPQKKLLSRSHMLSRLLVGVCICYSTGWSDIRDISRVVGIAAVKLHEAKPSVISPLYRKRVEYIPEFHCPCYNILIPWLHNGGAISLFFTLVGNISRRQVIFHFRR